MYILCKYVWYEIITREIEYYNSEIYQTIKKVIIKILILRKNELTLKDRWY